MAFNKSEYDNSYQRDKYDVIKILIPKGKKELLKEEATTRDVRDSKGKVSVSRMIVLALEKQYGLDLHTKD